MTPGTHDLVARLLKRQDECLSGARHYDDTGNTSLATLKREDANLYREAADALAALPPPADPPMVPAAESWCDVCTGTGKLLTGARCDLCRGTGKATEALIQLRVMLDTAHRQLARVDEIVGFPDGSGRGRIEMLQPRPADPPALVVLVREWQEAVTAYHDVRADDAAADALDTVERALAAYDLSAPASPAPEHRCGVHGFDQMRGDVCPACSARHASPAPMPTIQVGDVVLYQADRDLPVLGTAREGDDWNSRIKVLAIYRDPLWRRAKETR